MTFLTSLTVRKVVAAAITILAIFTAGYINAVSRATCSLADTTLPLKEIIAIDDFRTLMHVLVFGSVGFLVGPWGRERGSIRLIVLYVILGGLGIEIAQATFACDRGWKQLLDAGLDFCMDILGGWLGLLLARRYERVAEIIAQE